MILLAFATEIFVSGFLISYFAVWAFKTILNEPGSFAYEDPVAVLLMYAPSVSVAVA